MTEFKMPKCDSCNREAIHLCRDIQQDGVEAVGWQKYKVLDILRAGCDLHPVQSYEFDSSGNLVGALTDPEGRAIPKS